MQDLPEPLSKPVALRVIDTFVYSLREVADLR